MAKLNRLTRTEEQVMQIIWKLEKAFVKEIIAEMEKPKPPYNTISSVVRILEKKGFVDHEAFGKTHRYFPIISKEQYAGFALKQLVGGYFGNSYKSLVNFFASDATDGPPIEELEDMLKEIKKARKTKKS